MSLEIYYCFLCGRYWVRYTQTISAPAQCLSNILSQQSWTEHRAWLIIHFILSKIRELQNSTLTAFPLRLRYIFYWIIISWIVIVDKTSVLPFVYCRHIFQRAVSSDLCLLRRSAFDWLSWQRSEEYLLSHNVQKNWYLYCNEVNCSFTGYFSTWDYGQHECCHRFYLKNIRKYMSS